MSSANERGPEAEDAGPTDRTRPAPVGHRQPSRAPAVREMLALMHEPVLVHRERRKAPAKPRGK